VVDAASAGPTPAGPAAPAWLIARSGLFHAAASLGIAESADRVPVAAAGMHEPDWAPLGRVLPLAHCAVFMWMGWAVRPNGPPIAQYKHGITRRYLNLDEDGNAYTYTPTPAPTCCGRHMRIPLARAIDEVSEGLERMPGVNPAEARATPYDDAFRRARNDALRRAGFTVVEL
jgi:hypothetical protein